MKKVVKKAPVVEPKVETPVSRRNPVVEAPQNTVENYAEEFSHLVEQLKDG